MKPSDIKGVLALREQSHQYVIDNMTELFSLMFGEGPDLATQAVAATAIFDVANMLGIDLTKLKTDDVQAATVMLVGYMRFYSERQVAE